jgi:hypothetical protein
VPAFPSPFGKTCQLARHTQTVSKYRGIFYAKPHPRVGSINRPNLATREVKRKRLRVSAMPVIMAMKLAGFRALGVLSVFFAEVA